jgi:hypothetical protein
MRPMKPPPRVESYSRADGPDQRVSGYAELPSPALVVELSGKPRSL